MFKIGMDERRLLYFQETVQAGSMRAASDSLGVAPSSISRQIALLEAQVGLPLIESGRRNIKLTQAGQLVLDYIKEKRSQDEVFRSRLEDLHGLKTGEVHIAMGEGFINLVLGAALHDFIQHHPKVHISVMVANSNEIIRRVVEDEVHVGMVIDVPHEPKISIRFSSKLALMAVVVTDHPLAKRATVKLRDLLPYPIGLLDQSFRIRKAITAAEKQEGVFLSAAMTTNSLFLLRRFVASGLGVTILPSNVVLRELQEKLFRLLPIEGSSLDHLNAHIITRAGRQLPPVVLKLLSKIESARPI